MQAKPEDMAEFAHVEDVHRRIFGGMLRSLDNSVGAVMSRLRELDLEENTLVFFLSDNGGPTRELTSSNSPLRDGKGSMYEGGIRVPFLVQWQGTVPAGQVYDEPVTSLDIFLTVAAAADSPVRDGQGIDGVNLLPHLTGQEHGLPHNTLYWRMGEAAALRRGDWKLVRPRGRRTEAWELYNLAADRAEARDLAATEPELLSSLIEHWNQLNAQMVPPRF
jgi:arylsulfatase B